MIRRILLALFILSGIAHADWGNRLTDAYDVKQETKSDLQILQWISTDNLWELKDLDELGLEDYFLAIDQNTYGPQTVTGAPLFATGINFADDAILKINNSTGYIQFDDQSTDYINILNANVGIGTTAPIGPLEIYDNSAGGVGGKLILRNPTEQTDSSSNIYFTTGSGVLAVTNITSLIRSTIKQATPSTLKGNFEFYTNNGDALGEKLRITPEGKIGIGSTVPSSKLEVVGNSDIVQTLIKANATQTNPVFEVVTSGSSPLLYVLNSGSVGIGTTSPTEKLEVVGNIEIGDGAAANYYVNFHSSANSGTITFDNTNNYFTFTDYLRATTSLYRRYYHIPAQKVNPGASGATWVDPDANTIGGWRITADAQTLIFNADVHSDWDGATDAIVEVYFAVGVAGNPNDTIDLKLTSYYNAVGDSSTKTQNQTVVTTTDGTAYKVYKATFTINWDETSNNLEAGDLYGAILNLVTASSEIDNAIILGANFWYQKTHVGVEAGDT